MKLRQFSPLSGKNSEYGKDFMKMKFDKNDNLPLNKLLRLHMLTIIVRSVFEKDGKLNPQIYLDECLYELIRMEINIRQIKIKNRPHYFFNDNMIVNIKDLDSSLLEINKYHLRGFLLLVFILLNISLQKVLIM